MSSLLVIGATGQQGGSVVNAALSAGHDVVAFVRDPASPRAAALEERGVELRRGSLDDVVSLRTAMAEVDAVYAMTTLMEGLDVEVKHGMNIVDAVEQAAPDHMVFSSVASAGEGTGIGHFESKWEIEQRLAQIDTPWTVVAPGFFMDNYLFPWNTTDLAAGRLREAVAADTPLQLVDARDIGATVVAALADRDRFAGRRIEIAGDELAGQQIADALATGIGHPIRYEVQPLDEVAAFGDDMVRMYEWFNEGGYSVDIAALRSELPDVTFHTVDEFAQAHDWDAILGR